MEKNIPTAEAQTAAVSKSTKVHVAVSRTGHGDTWVLHSGLHTDPEDAEKALKAHTKDLDKCLVVSFELPD